MRNACNRSHRPTRPAAAATTAVAHDPDARITLAQAARLPQVQYDGRGPNCATLWRWSTRGVRGVRLETWMVGARKVTTPAAVDRFIAALSRAADAPEPAPAKVLSEHRRAEIELGAAGI